MNEPGEPQPFDLRPAVARVDNVYGDRNLVCACAGMEAHAKPAQA